MYIISGKYKGKKIEFPVRSGIKPTLTRIRQMIFDVLQFKVPMKCRVLDCFAGSGILGIESLSRWGGEAIFFESNRNLSNILTKNLLNLGVMLQCKVIFGNAMRPKKAEEPVDIIFLDPPYASSGIIDDLVKKLYKNQWLKQGTILVVETDKYTNIKLPDYCHLITERKSGNISLKFYNCNFEEKYEDSSSPLCQRSIYSKKRKLDILSNLHQKKFIIYKENEDLLEEDNNMKDNQINELYNSGLYKDQVTDKSLEEDEEDLILGPDSDITDETDDENYNHISSEEEIYLYEESDEEDDLISGPSSDISDETDNENEESEKETDFYVDHPSRLKKKDLIYEGDNSKETGEVGKTIGEPSVDLEISPGEKKQSPKEDLVPDPYADTSEETGEIGEAIKEDDIVR